MLRRYANVTSSSTSILSSQSSIHRLFLSSVPPFAPSLHRLHRSSASLVLPSLLPLLFLVLSLLLKGRSPFLIDLWRFSANLLPLAKRDERAEIRGAKRGGDKKDGWVLFMPLLI